MVAVPGWANTVLTDSGSDETSSAARGRGIMACLASFCATRTERRLVVGCCVSAGPASDVNARWANGHRLASIKGSAPGPGPSSTYPR
jgi:hypothetical protein